MRKLIFAILLVLFTAAPVWASTIVDDEDANDTVATAPIQISPEPDPNAHVGVLHLGTGDVDFVGLGPLAIGNVITAVSTPLENDFFSPDTVIGVFDAAGNRLAFNDDSPGVGFGSALSFEVSAEDVYFLSISGYGDPTFRGFHGESGDYALTVSVLPAPSSNAPPDCSAASAAPDGLWPLNQKLADISVLGVTDPNGDDVTLTITSIEQDEPITRSYASRFCGDGAGIGTDTARVRMTASSDGDGRVYSIGFTAMDAAGGACSGTVTVCAPRDLRGGNACVDQGPLFDSTACAE